MSSFINIEHSTQHPGVARVESAIDAAQQLRRGFSGTRGLAALLLAAMVAALMVVAYQVMDSVAEGHLLVIWVALWAVAFATLGLFAGTARKLAASLKAGLDSWSRSLAEARADVRTWEAAKADPRLMAELQAAKLRAEAAQPDTVATATAAAPAPGPAERTVKLGSSLLRAYQRNYI
ncbi:hypothetical protein [Polaromonas sp.]|uniref:hypothetical protein n=1 Tax=Polaromonas sp. TaxID=1869339 RepID=UPI002FC6AC48